jgi:hypothetical protein
LPGKLPSKVTDGLAGHFHLLRFPVHGVLAAVRAILFNFHAARIIPAIFLAGVISLFAIGARKGDHRADVFLFRSHISITGGAIEPAPPLL